MSAEVVEIEKSRRPRTQVPHDRSRLVHALEGLNRALGGAFEVPSLADVATWDEDQFQAFSAHLIEQFTVSISALYKPKVPSIDAQLESFRIWQLQHPEYYHWPPSAMNALRSALVEIGPGAELVPCYALSVGIKTSDSRITLYDRRGKVTAG